MKKKYIKYGILSILSLVIIYFVFFGIQNYSLKKTYRNNYISENDGGLIKSVLARCNYNILDPEIADVYLTEANDLSVSFHKPKRLFSANRQEWEKSYIGGTTIKNTTFENLLGMVQEDCEQFKINGKQKNISWVFMPYDYKKEQERKEEREEIEKKILEELKNRKPLSKKEMEDNLKESKKLEREARIAEIKNLKSDGVPEEDLLGLIKEYGLEKEFLRGSEEDND